MSWYPETKLDKKQLRYLYLLQKIWRVKDASDEWVPYDLQPHQIHWHSQDIAVLREKAKDRVVVKSRNTSFTVSSIISNLMAVPNYSKQIVPFIRLNKERAIDLLEECKDIIRNMTPILLKDGRLYPFDPSQVQMDKALSITFPNGTEFRAMPANAASAETIRGMRIMGSAGVIDEGNFMKSFAIIYIALRDAARGAKDGHKEYQMNIGTTRKGRMTNYNLWYEDILRTRPDNILLFHWPVISHTELDLNKSLLEQNESLDLKENIIVPWHDLQDLENKRKENLNTFKEEYMAILVDDEAQLYDYAMIEAAIDEDLENKEPEEGRQYTIGIDPASASDYFAIVIFDKNTKEQQFLYYSQHTPLKTMETYCDKLIAKWRPWRVVVDGNGLGFQLSQTLKNKYGNVVKIIRGVASVKVPGKRIGNIPMKEFLHTNLIRMLNYNEIRLMQNELQSKHFLMWKNDYTCEADSKYGHGDLVIAIGLALLPENYKTSSSGKLAAVREKEIKTEKPIEVREDEIEW